jgi:hypothetical protein
MHNLIATKKPEQLLGLFGIRVLINAENQISVCESDAGAVG